MHLEKQVASSGVCSGFRSMWLGHIKWKGKLVPVHGAKEGDPPGPEDLETKEAKS